MTTKEMDKKKTGDEKPLTAVVIVETFSPRLSPLLSDGTSWGSCKLANLAFLDYCLEWIHRSDISHVILLVAHSNADSMNRLVAPWLHRFVQVLVVQLQHFASVGDALRELHERSLVTHDFLLVTSPSILCAFDLRPHIAAFKKRRSLDKNNIMSLIYSADGDVDRGFIGLERHTHRLLLHHRHEDDDEKKFFSLDKDFCLRSQVEIRSDVRDSGVALCSMNIFTLFGDNFDFLALPDVLREVLANEEVLNYSIHVQVLAEHEIALWVKDFQSYFETTMRVLRRWTFPLVPEKIYSPNEPGLVACYRENVYLPADVIYDKLLRNVKIGANTILGPQCAIGSGTAIRNSSIGKLASIGAGCSIVDCVVGERVVIGQDCHIEHSFIANDVHVGDNCHITPRCILAPKTCLPANTRLPSDTVLAPVKSSGDGIISMREHGCFSWKLAHGGSFWTNEDTGKSTSSDESDSQPGSSPPHTSPCPTTLMLDETVQRFLEEITESLQRAVPTRDAIATLKLEINTFKLAYNIAMEDVARMLMRAFLSLPQAGSFAQLKKLTGEWTDLLLNYYKPMENQMQALLAIEEHLLSHPDFASIVPHFIQLLYQLDILEEEALLQWHHELGANARIRPLIGKFMDWLKTAESDSE